MAKQQRNLEMPADASGPKVQDYSWTRTHNDLLGCFGWISMDLLDCFFLDDLGWIQMILKIYKENGGTKSAVVAFPTFVKNFRFFSMNLVIIR